MVLGNCPVWDGDINSLAPERCGSNFQKLIFKLFIIQITHNCSLGTHIDIALWWVPQNLTKEKSTLVRVMAWCHQAPNHYLNQCLPRSVSPCDITRPQWVTHWGLNKMANILQTTFTNTFSFVEWKLLYFASNIPKVCSFGSIDLVWWHQAITRTNVNLSLMRRCGIDFWAV